MRVFAADSQTIPTSNFRGRYAGSQSDLSLYITRLLNWPSIDYASHAAGILTPTTVVQGVDYHSWGLYCHHCYWICVCWDVSVGYITFHVDMASYAHAPPRITVHTHAWPLSPWGVSFTPKHIAPGRGNTILRLIRRTTESHETDSRNPEQTASQV